MSDRSVPIYRLYGLRVKSEIPLPCQPYPESDFDVEVIRGENREVPQLPASSEIYAAAEFTPTQGYFLSRSGDKFHLRLYGFSEFVLSPHSRQIIVHRDPRSPEDLPAIFIVGNVLTFWLSLHGEFVLHASAVARQGEAVAFVGSSGMGKSTLAALAAQSGFQFLADDVVRFFQKQDKIFIYPGPGEIRLRPNAAGLAGDKAPSTPDQRISLRHEPPQEPTALSAVVIPRPSRVYERLEVSLLSKAQGLFYLSAFPRVWGWVDPQMIMGQFQAYAKVASFVPVYEARIPWGPPFAEGLIDHLAEQVGLPRHA